MEKRKRDNRIWFCCGAVLFAASFLLLYLARRIRGMGQWYAMHIYPVIVGTVGRISGLVPFSVAEAVLYVLLALSVVLLIRAGIRCIRQTDSGERGLYAQHYLAGIWLGASILFLLYTLNCGINYQRISFSESEGLITESYSVEELKRVCEILTRDVNTYASQVERDGDGLMTLDGTERARAVEAMNLLGTGYAEMAGYYPKPKALTGSWILSVQSLTGVYAPFTVEANYNQDMTAYNIPFTACHELSHLRGFMQEEEANFIAYLACMESSSAEFRYSGSMLGWINAMNVLRKEDYAAWKEIREQMSEEAIPDLRANNAFWAAHDGAVAEVSERMNDNYLKANGQSDGVKSYGRMVDLLVVYYRQQRL